MQDSSKDITLESIEARIADGELTQAAELLQSLTGRSLQEVLPLIDVLGRKTMCLEDVRVLKKWGWKIRAILRYKQLYGDDITVAKRIVETMDEPPDSAKIETLIATGNLSEARELVRLHTGKGPKEAEAKISKLQQCQLEEMIALVKQGSRSVAIRQYQRMHGCTLLEAKRGMDALLSAS